MIFLIIWLFLGLIASAIYLVKTIKENIFEKMDWVYAFILLITGPIFLMAFIGYHLRSKFEGKRK